MVDVLLGCLYELAVPVLLLFVAIPDWGRKSLFLLLLSPFLFVSRTVLLVLLEANRALLLEAAIAEHDLALDAKLARLLGLLLLLQCFAHLWCSLNAQCFLDIVYKSDAHF